MAFFVENFSYPNGTLSTALWTNAGATQPQVVGGKMSTDAANANLIVAAYRPHGLTFSGNVFQMEWDANNHNSDNEGVGVVLLHLADSSGYGCYFSNNIHIQRFNPGGAHDNLTNDDYNGGVGDALLSYHAKMTYDGTTLSVYRDGTLVSQITDNVRTPGEMTFIEAQSTNSPGFECKMDNLVISTSIGAIPPPMKHYVRRQRTGLWTPYAARRS